MRERRAQRLTQQRPAPGWVQRSRTSTGRLRAVAEPFQSRPRRPAPTRRAREARSSGNRGERAPSRRPESVPPHPSRSPRCPRARRASHPRTCSRKGDSHLGVVDGQAFFGADVEGNAGPSPVVDGRLHGHEAFRGGTRVDPRLASIRGRRVGGIDAPVVLAAQRSSSRTASACSGAKVRRSAETRSRKSSLVISDVARPITANSSPRSPLRRRFRRAGKSFRLARSPPKPQRSRARRAPLAGPSGHSP